MMACTRGGQGFAFDFSFEMSGYHSASSFQENLLAFRQRQTDGIFMVLPWDFHGASMVLPLDLTWCVCGPFMVLQ